MVSPRDRDATFWNVVEAVFTEVRELTPAARPPWLDARCDDPSVRSEVEALLEADGRAGEFLEAPAATGPPFVLADPRLGMRVGAFEIVERIGAGGMGVVYRARRVDGQFEQQVAVKFVGGRLFEPSHVARFETERQILAQLQHPNVVALLDGGVTDLGQPYLVMEHVDGVPITVHVTRERLPLDRRLDLFRAVCAAVAHAHQHFVIHRDLKPANVLVTPLGVVKVLDFGVAKLLRGESEPVTLTGVIPGPLTPDYASPEQLRGVPLSTASDLYALGVLLYELVAGRRPYETTGKPLDEVLALVVQHSPVRPSAAVTGDLPYSRRAIAGDLDAVIQKALAKAPADRYRSVEELSADVLRWLKRQPVVAREPSLGYLLRRLATRHSAAFSVGLVALVLLVSASAATWRQAGIAAREKTRAEARARDVRALANAMIFRVHDAIQPLPGSTPVRRIVVEEALGFMDRLAEDAADDRTLQLELAQAYLRLGEVQGDPARANLGDPDGAIRSFGKASRLYAALAKAPDASYDVLDGYVSAARRLSALYATRDVVRARATLEDAAPYATRARAVDGESVRARSLHAHLAFARAQLEDGEAAVAAWRRALPLYEALLGESPDDPGRKRNLALVEKYLGSAYDRLRLDADAAVHYERAFSLDSARLSASPDDRTALTDVAIDLANAAALASRAGRFAEAIAGYDRSYHIRRRLLEADPRDVFLQGRLIAVTWRLAATHLQAGHVARALALATDAEGAAARLGRDHAGFLPDRLQSLRVLADVLAVSGDAARACRAYREVDALAAERHGDTSEASSIERLRSEVAASVAACAATGKPARPPSR